MGSEVEANFHDSVARLIGLEGKYFTYSLFGKLAEFHLSLSKALSISPYESVKSQASEHAKDIFLSLLIKNVSQLAREMEANNNYFPAFIVSRDLDFLSQFGVSGLLNSRNVEMGYQRALNAMAGILSNLYRLDGCVSKLTSMRKSLSQEDNWQKFLPLGVSAAASFVNPFALIGVAQQGASLYSRNEMKSSMEVEAKVDVYNSSSQEWDYIVTSLLPSATYRMFQEIYPIRLGQSAIILEAYEKSNSVVRKQISATMAKRLSRLVTFMNFPSSLDPQLTREQIVDFLIRLQNFPDLKNFRYF
ncbi:hypothetical protein VI06_16150 [Aquitalea magnusonii]|nr:hypothetical protein VI06_16150 [Aquitalea magnusonii]